MRHWLLGCLLMASATACERAPDEQGLAAREQARSALGLMTSLPIYWGEPADLSDLLNSPADPHWARVLLEKDYELVPLDSLGTADGAPEAELAELDRLLVAQPRALTAADNVALDGWVRNGGRLLLVLDPMMTEHSAYPVGDRRRFNDVALIPPLLERWGLSLRHAGGAAPTLVRFQEAILPVEDHGLIARTEAGGSADCMIEAGGVVATCRIGAGRALIVADAAFLNHEDADLSRRDAAQALVQAAFN